MTAMKQHFPHEPHGACQAHWRLVMVAVCVAASVDVATGQSTLRVVNLNDSSASVATPSQAAGGPARQTNHSEQRAAEPSGSDLKSGSQVVETSQAAPLYSRPAATTLAPVNRAATTTANGNRPGSSELRVVTPPGKVAASVPPVVVEPLPIASTESIPAGLEPRRLVAAQNRVSLRIRWQPIQAAQNPGASRLRIPLSHHRAAKHPSCELSHRRAK